MPSEFSPSIAGGDDRRRDDGSRPGLGKAAGFADVAIAATAQARGLTILTRNVRHFQAIYARVLNPIDGPPPPLAYVASETPNGQ